MSEHPLSPPDLEPGGSPAAPLAIRKRPDELRSARWFGPADLRSFGHRTRAMQMGYSPEEWTGKPVIAILNTWSDLQPCHMHFKQRVDDVKRGVLMAGGFPVELPALSMSESYLKPTSMLYRNMLAMEAEELLRSHPIDGRGPDGRLRQVHAGPAARRDVDGRAGDLPAGRPHAARQLAGQGAGLGLRLVEILGRAARRQDHRPGLARRRGRHRALLRHLHDDGHRLHDDGHRGAVGMVLPGGSSIPAADAGHIRLASESGRRIVAMVWEDLTPKRIQTRAAFGNAITVAMAMGCSTNAIIHLIAMARRAGHDTGLADFERYSRRVPVIGNVRPSGDRYLMEDFFYAGGIRALMNEIREHLDLDCLTVTGRTLGENIAGAEVYNADVIRPTSDPIYGEGSLAVLHGNLAPDGCVIKPAAMDQRFLKHSGPALVFDDYPSLKRAVDDEDLDVTADHVLVLRNAGPQGGPGMPEWGMLPMPKKLLKQGHRDMLRLSDARMSGTSYGACVLHVSPESFVGGPLALLRTGDLVRLDVAARTIAMEVSDAELAARRAAWVPPAPRYERGYGWAFSKHIQQADQGCDFDFLRTEFGAPVPEPAIF